ncbi:hypothetical protein CLU79DRAFT_719451 [Phycomyces nitens]|nr:hypothetical protein CLU79DRAFT_719451 [Phycomyces nitens]
MPTELMSDWNSPPLSTSPKQTHPISFTSTVLSPVQTVQKHNQESTIGSPRSIIEPSKQTGPSWSDKPSKPTLQLEDFLSSKPTQPSEPQAKTQSPIQSLLPLDDFWSAKPVQTTKVMNSSPAPSPMDDFWSNAFIKTKPAEPVKHSYPAHSTQSFQTTHNVFGKQETLPNSVQNILPHTNTPSHTLQPDTKSSETTSDFDFGDFSSAPLGSQANNDDDFGDFESSSQHGDWPSTWVDTSNPTPFKQPTKEEDDWGEWATFK